MNVVGCGKGSVTICQDIGTDPNVLMTYLSCLSFAACQVSVGCDCPFRAFPAGRSRGKLSQLFCITCDVGTSVVSKWKHNQVHCELRNKYILCLES